MEHDKDKALREDLLFVCHHSAVANNDPSVLRSLLFRKTQITPNSWQGFALSSDLWDNLSLSEGERISRIRSNHTRIIEGYLIELASSFGGFSKQILAIAHAVEYFLFITSPNFSKYDDIDQLRRRSLQMIHFMAQRIRIRRRRRTRKRKCLDDRPLTVKAVKIEYCPKSDIIHHEAWNWWIWIVQFFFPGVRSIDNSIASKSVSFWRCKEVDPILRHMIKNCSIYKWLMPW